MNALFALDSGFTGQGVTVGIIDDGAVNVNGELDGRISDLSRDFGYETRNGVRTKRNSIGDEMSEHGTPIANIIAGNRNNSGPMGFAPDARLAILRVDEVNYDTKESTMSHSIAALNYAGEQKIKVVNRSMSQATGPYDAFSSALTRFGQSGGLVVNSAGNNGGANPNDAPAVNDFNRNSIIFVGALVGTTQRYELAAYSNKAGTMKDRFVVAVGENITTNVSGNVAGFLGTSSAAPVVTALAATILSKWPQLTGQQAGDVILTTAKDIGAPGVDEVFGRGVVDFQAALAPVNPRLSNGVTSAAIQNSVMALPPQMSVSDIRNALSDVTVLDDFGRNYNGSVSEMVLQPATAQRSHWLRRRVAQMNDGGVTGVSFGGLNASFGYATYQFGPNQADVNSVVTAGDVSFVSGKFGFRAGWNAQDSLQSDIMGLAPFADGILAYAPQAGNSFGVDRYIGRSKVGLTLSTGSFGEMRATAVTAGWSNGSTDVRLSYIDETGSVMGTPTGNGALRLGEGAQTVMIEGHHTFKLGGDWDLEAYGSVGLTRLKIDRASLVTGATDILGSRLGIQASGPAFGGMLSFGVAQPLNVERGTAQLTVGTGYDLDTRSLTFGQRNADLSGERSLQITAGFAKSNARSSFRIGFMQDVTRGETSALAGWSMRF